MYAPLIHFCARLTRSCPLDSSAIAFNALSNDLPYFRWWLHWPNVCSGSPRLSYSGKLNRHSFYASPFLSMCLVMQHQRVVACSAAVSCCLATWPAASTASTTRRRVCWASATSTRYYDTSSSSSRCVSRSWRYVSVTLKILRHLVVVIAQCVVQLLERNRYI